jgi:anti-sigma B factor antagonist
VLLDAVRTLDAPVLDLSEVTEFDCAGMQLLLVARREADQLGKQLTLQGASPAVRDAFALLGMTAGGEIA